MHRADPGDVARWPVEGGDIVGLEDAEGVDETPSVHDDQVTKRGCIQVSIDISDKIPRINPNCARTASKFILSIGNGCVQVEVAVQHRVEETGTYLASSHSTLHQGVVLDPSNCSLCSSSSLGILSHSRLDSADHLMHLDMLQCLRSRSSFSLHAPQYRPHYGRLNSTPTTGPRDPWRTNPQNYLVLQLTCDWVPPSSIRYIRARIHTACVVREIWSFESEELLDCGAASFGNCKLTEFISGAMLFLHQRATAGSIDKQKE